MLLLRKPKLLQVKRAQLHLRDLSAAQLAAVISGLMPRLTPLQLLKIGGEILQAIIHFLSVEKSSTHAEICLIS